MGRSRLGKVVLRLLALGCLLLTSCETFPSSGASRNTANRENRPKHITILVLLDGFRADYLDRGITPNLVKIASNGVRGTLTPAFPSVTFPNHFAQITGLYPDQHGIVGNVFEDNAMPKPFNPFTDTQGMNDPRWWSGAIPIWALAEEQGLKATRTQWVVNGYDRRGTAGSNLQPLDYAAPPDRGADRFLELFSEDPENAPDLSLLFFHQADSAGHRYGPDAPETNAAIAQLDTAIGKIISGLKQRGLWEQVNIVFTADHGMAKYVPGQVIFLDDFADPLKFRLIGYGPYAEVVPENDATVDDVAPKLVGHHGPMTCWRKESLPPRFRYGKNERVAPILCLADPGWVIVEREGFDPKAWSGASHGYDPESSSMGALFLAHGPAFCAAKLAKQRIDAVDIYPLLANLAGIRVEPHSGNLSNVAPLMRSHGRCVD